MCGGDNRHQNDPAAGTTTRRFGSHGDAGLSFCGRRYGRGVCGLPSPTPGIRPQPRPRQYVEPNCSGERLSHRDHYEIPHQANHEDVPCEGRYTAPPRAHDAWVPQRPGPVAHLAKMQDFQGEGSDRLDSFFDHVEELADFYRWDGRETCRQARAHLRGTALAYVKQAPFQPRT